MKTITVSVINDLTTDQRVARTCSLLHESGFNVILIGRILPKSISLNQRPYLIKRFKIWKNKGSFFYLFFNIRLFFYLLFKKVDVLFANDLDTLLANTLVSIFRRKPLIYDSHEFFLGVPEIQNRKFVKKTWSIIQTFCFKHIDSFITVNDSIANLYKKSFNKEIQVVRNVPMPLDIECFSSRNELGLPENRFIIIMQGAGINVDRGYEEAIQSLQYLDNVLLLIIGSGDVIDELKQLSISLKLTDKVTFISKIPYSEMMKYTSVANVGLTLDKSLNINYKLSLPNKLFDYINAGIPVVGSDLIEVKNIIDSYHIGIVVDEVTPIKIANAIKQLSENFDVYELYKNNSREAAKSLNWNVEKKKLEKVIAKYA